MKLKKLLKKMYHNKFGSGTTFYIKENGEIDYKTFIEYDYDIECDIHTLYLVEPQLKENGNKDILNKYELPASLIINKDIRFILKDLVTPLQ